MMVNRATSYESTGLTPNELMLGSKFHMSVDIHVGHGGNRGTRGNRTQGLSWKMPMTWPDIAWAPVH